MMPALSAPGSKVLAVAARLEAEALRYLPPEVADDPAARGRLRQRCMERASVLVSERVQ